MTLASKPPARKAMRLGDGIGAFGPAPISFEPGGNAAYYVQRHDEPLNLLRTELLHAEGTDKYLLAGHRGSGKSTELNRLSTDSKIRERYEIVKFSVKDELDITDVSHIDLLFTALSLVFDRLVSQKSEDRAVDLGDDAINELDDWRSKVTERLVTTDRAASAETEAGAKIGLLTAFFASFGGRLRVERTTREATRKVVEPRLSDFFRTLDRFLADVALALHKHGKELLLIVEDLDKMPDIDRALELFSKRGIYLAKPSCRIIYTVPIALHYSKEFQGVAARLGQNAFLPNVAIHDALDGTTDPGSAVMRQLVLKRLDTSLIESDALQEAVGLSGGVFQQLQRLMRAACTYAVAKQVPAITLDEVRDAAADLRSEFDRTLSSEDMPILAKVASTKHAAADDSALALLHSLHVIEYRNDDRWCALNPLLKPILDRWERTHPG